MSTNDILLLNMYAVKPLIPCLLALLIASVAAFAIILVKSRGMWFGSKNFALSLFSELRSVLAIKLACAWIKCVTVCFFLLSFTQLTGVHYIFVLTPCIIILLLNASLVEWVTHLVSIAIQIIGLFAANILCSYIIQFEMKLAYIFLYVLIAIVLSLYSVYIFISEIDFISARRSIKFENTRQTRDQSEG